MNLLRAVVVTLLWFAGLALFVLTTRPFPVVELVGAVVLAVVVGALWLRGSEASRRIAKYLVWFNAVGGLIWAMAFAPDMFAGAWLAGVCAFGCLVALVRLLSVGSKRI